MREHILRVTIHDCEVQTFRAGGKGGQNQNKRDTGVRIIHHPSGARAECREERNQLENKKKAWKKLVQDSTFRQWLVVTSMKLPSIESLVEEQMVEENLVVEVKQDGKWQRA